ncbi:hypothetical protein CCHR01_12103 [Colletotrichum chrysophilum]|uniref:Uncharacterized protein n=1 Tax=Colletotrichum chrysophilum TaxID=1836956 RepID=A0AAD9ABU3_9PEZI|nr:hypothetical protein CCHR01_12103 [Colletotrichum chrysophilum]
MDSGLCFEYGQKRNVPVGVTTVSKCRHTIDIYNVRNCLALKSLHLPLDVYKSSSKAGAGRDGAQLHPGRGGMTQSRAFGGRGCDGPTRRVYIHEKRAPSSKNGSTASRYNRQPSQRGVAAHRPGAAEPPVVRDRWGGNPHQPVAPGRQGRQARAPLRLGAPVLLRRANRKGGL